MEAENWISIAISALNYGILLEKNSFTQYDSRYRKNKTKHEDYQVLFSIYKLHFEL